MKKRFLYILLFISVVSGVGAQRRYGLYGHRNGDGYSILMGGTGPAYLFGDVGGSMKSTLFKGTTFNFASTRGFVALGYRYIFPNNLSLRFNAMYGSFFGTDTLTKLQARKYVFQSDIFESSIQGELFLIGGPRQLGSTKHSLYLFAGGGVIVSAPHLTGNNRATDIIKTNVVGITPVLPFGLGYEYYLGNGFSVGGEMAFRYAYGDFLDGLKTPDSDNNDVLTNFNITFSYNFSLGNPYR